MKSQIHPHLRFSMSILRVVFKDAFTSGIDNHGETFNAMNRARNRIYGIGNTRNWRDPESLSYLN